MPDAIAEAPPAAPPAAPAPDTQSPPPPPPPKGELHVSPATVDNGPKATPPKKGSARDRMNQDLQKLVKPQFWENAEEDQQNRQASPAAPSPTVQAAEVTKGVDAAPPAPAPASDPKAGEKKNPWKLVDEYKARAAKAESDLLETRKVLGSPEQVKEYQTQMETLRKQNEELENEIRFTNYAKSNEFKSKYQEPYEKAWTRAVKELSEVSVTDPATGQERPATVADLAELVNLPLGKARAAADAIFGPFADDVMQYRKEIQGLYEQQNQALEEAKNKGIQRDKERNEQVQRFQSETAVQIKAHWDKANEEFLKDPDLAPVLAPRDGDEEGNKRLEAGFKLVDQAFAERSDDPRMSAEARALVVKRHAAVRLRAAAFGRVYSDYKAMLKKHNALVEELAQYKGSVPGTGGSPNPSPAPPGQPKAWDQVRAGLQKLAQH